MEAAGCIPSLHDAVLEGIEVEWERGDARVAVTLVPGGPAQIICCEMCELRVPRRQNWGPSIYINRGEVRPTGQGLHVLWIEMQSGDQIEVCAARIDVRRLDT